MSAELSAPTFGEDATARRPLAILSTAHMWVEPGTALGKHPRHAEDTYDEGNPRADDSQEPRPHKKGKAKMVTNGVLGAAGSTSRVFHSP